jgi:PKD repeat protein
VSLQATPSSIPETGGAVTLLAVVRDDQGQPLPGATANFTTEIGRLSSGGGFLTTDASGQVSDRLTVNESDIDALPATTSDFTVGVEVGGSGNVVTKNFTIRLESPILEADFTFNATTLTVQFTDLTNGDPTSFRWTFGDGSVSTEQNPRHSYAAAGSYSVTLKVTRGRSESQITKTVTISQ